MKTDDRVEMVQMPCTMTFEDVTVVLERGSFGRDKPVDYVEAQFAWRGGSDKLRLTAEKATKEEMEAFYDEMKPYNGKDCRVVFKVAARRGQWGNDYRLLEIAEITVLGDGSPSKVKPTSSGVI